MADEKPTVSVVLPTYNRAHLVGGAIQSVLDQTYRDFEIIVVDDGSSDNTEEVIKSFSDPRIRYVRHQENRGGSAARNTGIKLAKGEFIAFQDSDDEWLSEKLDKQIKTIKNLNFIEWGGIYCGFYLVLNKRCVEKKATMVGNLKRELLNEELDIGASSTLLFPIEVITEIGLFDETFDRHQDWEYLIRFFRRYKLFAVEEPLVKVYGHNMPSAEKAVKIKEKYLSKFKDDIYEFGEVNAKKILAKHWLEVSYVFAGEGKVIKSIYYLCKSISYKLLPPKKFLNLLYFIGLGVGINLMKLLSGKKLTTVRK